MSLGLRYKTSEPVFCEVEGETPYLQYPLLSKTGVVQHGFSTRLGGVSKGCYSSLNLSFSRKDREEDVRENFKRITEAMGLRCEDMVFSRQTHTTNVRPVTEQDRGAGWVHPAEYQDVDGMITNVPGICLVTFYADCVPLYFVDPVKRAIGLSHSGWRGTVGKIGRVTVERMRQQYGCNPADLYAAIGPSICQECYEVSEEVIAQFRMNFARQYWEDLFYRKENGKYQLNLWKANEIVLLESGLAPDHIAVTNLCTHCNSTLLFSHRTMGEQRGNLAAFLALK